MASECAMEDLGTVVPAVPAEQFDLVAAPCSLPSRRQGFNRICQVVKTAIPLVLADVVCLTVVFLLASMLVASISGRLPPRIAAQLITLCCGYLLCGMMFG